MRRVFWIVYLFFAAAYAYGQNTSDELSFDAFIERVSTHHPLVFQAELLLAKGEAKVMESRGLFDPKFIGNLNQKYFDDKQYYSIGQGDLKIPTWFGLEFLAGYEQNEGVFLNPENNMPPAGLWYAGASLPLLNGLLIDERRAQLRLAQTFLEISKTDQALLLNDLYFKAAKAYWDWFTAYHQLRINQNALAVAQERFRAIKQNAQAGDIPFIDTLEAGIQVQNRQLSLYNSEVFLAQSQANLEVYLWQEGLIPLELDSSVSPEPYGLKLVLEPTVNELYLSDSLVLEHPLLRRFDLEQDQLNIELRFAREQLKPNLNLKYNALNAPVGDNPFAEYNMSNYTWGIQFSYPLFLRKERAKIRQSKIALESLDLKQRNNFLSIKQNAFASIKQWRKQAQMVSLYARTVNDLERLLQGERTLFDIGESSLFLINSRELSFINAKQKWVELMAKNQMAQMKFWFTLGILQDQY